VTAGGIVATVRKIYGDDEIELEISPGVIVTGLRSTIVSIRESSGRKKAPHEQHEAKEAKS
jgi:preprotein translocase subunit YajC